MTRGLPLIVLVFALAFFFITERSHYFAGGESGPDVVHLWAASTPAQTMAELKAEFETQYPDLRLEIQTVAWQNLQEKTLWAVAANSNVPDLIVGSSEWTGGLANNGALEPFDSYMEPGFFARFFPPALATYQFPEVLRDKPGHRGALKQYGIPLDLDMMMIFYRADMVEPVMEKLGMAEFPSEWDDFAKLGEAVHQHYDGRDDTPHLIYLDPEDPVPLRMAFLPSAGGSLFDTDMRKAVFDEPEAEAAFKYFARLLHNNTAKLWNRSTMGDPFDLIKGNRVLGNVSGPWYTRFLEVKAPEQAGQWRVAPFPRRAPMYPSCGLGGSCLAMPYNAPNKRGAIALARFMSTDRFALAYFRRIGSPPPQITAWRDPVFDQPSPYFGGQRVYRVVRQVIDSARPLQLLPSAEVVKRHVRWALGEIAERPEDASQILEKAVERAQETIEKR